MTILIVDDDVVSRMMLMYMIDSATAGRFDVLEAEDGEQAWQLLDGGTVPALLFCDLRMPRLTGMELLARVKADPRFEGLPFVLVSAAGDAATMERALGLGADGYIVKPFDAARVAGHLARLPDKAPAGSAAQEPPHATLHRLGIDAVRLGLYLGGLQRQLDAAAADLAQPAADAAAMRAQLARLGEGCRTLGLFDAAAGFAALQGAGALDHGVAARALDAAGRAVQRQAQAVQALS